MEKDAPKDPTRSPSSGSEDSEDEVASEQASKDGTMTAETSLDPNVLKSRREKRLAMNRASARARRKRKKELLGSLAAQVQELNNQNQALQSKNDSLSRRVEQLEAALAQAQNTIATLSSGNAAAAGVGGLGESTALRSLLLGGGSGLSGAASGLGAGLSYETLLTARAQQHLEMQNQLRLLGGTGLGGAGLGGAGLGAGLPSALGSDRLGSLAGVSGLGSLLGTGGGLGAGMPSGASQLDSLVRAKTAMQAAEDQGSTAEKTSSPAKGEEDEAAKTAGAAIQDGPANKKVRL